MLVLSRKKNESIIINDDVTIVVVEIRGDKVRLGVEAPKEMPVHQNEVYEAIRRETPKDVRIRQHLEELKRQVRELEAELTLP
jgi:carbon storage regulator